MATTIIPDQSARTAQVGLVRKGASASSRRAYRGGPLPVACPCPLSIFNLSAYELFIVAEYRAGRSELRMTNNVVSIEVGPA
jgi:hypothetical protein